MTLVRLIARALRAVDRAWDRLIADHERLTTQTETVPPHPPGPVTPDGDEVYEQWRAGRLQPPVVFNRPTPEEIAEFKAEWRAEHGEDPSAEVLEQAMPLCDLCGWTVGMVCPECPGCGCYPYCTGWRHREFAGDDDLDDRGYPECEWCGGSPYCTCCPDCGAESVADCSCPIPVALEGGGELVL